MESAELQEFLAYGSDASLAYVKAKARRLDRVLLKNFKGALRLILPSDLAPEGPKTDTTSGHKKRAPKAIILKIDTKFGENLELEKTLEENNSEIMDMSWIKDQTLVGEELESRDMSPPDTPLGPRVRGDGCDDDPKSGLFEGRDKSFLNSVLEELRRETPTADSAFDLVTVIALEGTSCTSLQVVLLKLLFNQMIERFISQLIQGVATGEKWVHLLHLLHKSIWDPKQEGEQSVSEMSGFTPNEAHEAVETYLQEALPCYRLVSHKISRALNVILKQLESRHVNKFIIYQIMNSTLHDIKSL
jgi:hypothetical protein